MIQSFIFVFFPALIVELIRQKLLPFGKLINVNRGAGTKKQKPSEEEKEQARK